MKMQSNNLLSPISRNDLNNLASQVKESLAIGLNSKVAGTFCTADLWNIQRNYRSTASRRRFI